MKRQRNRLPELLKRRKRSFCGAWRDPREVKKRAERRSKFYTSEAGKPPWYVIANTVFRGGGRGWASGGKKRTGPRRGKGLRRSNGEGVTT